MVRTKVCAPVCELGEGPLWRRESNEFLYLDIEKGRIYAFEYDTKLQSARLLLECGYRIGAAVLDENGDLVLLTERGVFLCPYGGSEKDFRLLWSVPMKEKERFNDAVADPKGRILAGTKREENCDGKLWIFESGRKPDILLEGLSISNGMGFSSDGSTFYHTDSGLKTIFLYNYDLNNGKIRDGEPFIILDSREGAVPDGMTVDSEDRILTAVWGGNAIRIYSPKGILEKNDKILPTQVSSVMLGGKNLRTLCITSASIGLGNRPEEGTIWIEPYAAPGKEEYRAKLKVGY